MTITIKTYNQILGEMVRKILPNTPLNDINAGSALMTLLEAAASSDFDNNTAVLSLLELLNIDALRNNDLDSRAADYGIARITAQKATGSVTVTDTSFTKRATSLYSVKPAPIAGSTELYVNNAADWEQTGNLYIGRGTQSYEGPIAYTQVDDMGSFYRIKLGSALKKDHLLSDMVVDEQGKLDRRIAAGTPVLIPANNLNPDIKYTVLREAVIPAGEDTVAGVLIIAQKAGSGSNAAIGTITAFDSEPFDGAAVTNVSALTDGRDVESDADLRERLKAYTSTLARGTRDSILAAILGVSDVDENKQVQSAVIKEPVEMGAPAIVYLDDGRGFQPSYTGQGVDPILTNASGVEEFLQLANYPLPRPQAVNTVSGPYQLAEGMQFVVAVDGLEEGVEFTTDQFVNITAATLPEIVIAINDQAETFKCRLDQQSTRLLVYPVDYDAEMIQVVERPSGQSASLWANEVLGFPTTVYSYITLYRNNELLREKAMSAVLTTRPISQWNLAFELASGTLGIAVDGTPTQLATFLPADFSGATLDAATLEQWVAAFNAKFAGITATATTSDAIQIVSNRIGINSQLTIVDGTLNSAFFTGMDTSDVGQNSDFQLNRQTGNLRITTGISAGDSITAGTVDAKGSVVSTATSDNTYNLATKDGTPADAVLVADGQDVAVHGLVGLLSPDLVLSVTHGSGKMQITSNSLLTFSAVQPGDYLYISSHGSTPTEWFDAGDCGLFRVVERGGHTTAGSDSWIAVRHTSTGSTGHDIVPTTLGDIQAFRSDVYPQLWRGSDTDTLTISAAPISDIMASLNSLSNIKASLFKTDAIKTSSSTESDGSIATPVSVGNATAIFTAGTESQFGNPPHAATRITSRDSFSSFKRSAATEELLGCWSTAPQSGTLTSDATISDDYENDPYSEKLQSTVFDPAQISALDQMVFTTGPNKGHFRSFKEITEWDTAGTQQATPRTLFPHKTGDELLIMKSLTFSPDDNIIFVVDKDSVNKTIVVPMSRTGRVNALFPATNSAFSAWDSDNESGVSFDTLQIWGKSVNNTEFKDYAVWFRARNWYTAGGIGATGETGADGASMIVRAKEYGPHGEKIRFRIALPSFPDQDPTISHINFPSGTDVVCTLGSDAARSISLAADTQFHVGLTGGYCTLTFTPGEIDLSAVEVGDTVAIDSSSGVGSNNLGNFRIAAKGTNTITFYNPDCLPTDGGVAQVDTITAIGDTVGTHGVNTVTVVGVGASVDNTYFTLQDDVGTVGVWYSVNGATGVAPATGCARNIAIPTVSSYGGLAKTAANTAVNTTTDAIAITTHGFTTGQSLRATMSGGWPTSTPTLNSSTAYYAVVVDTGNFKLSTSYAGALAGTGLVDFTAQGATGSTLTLTPADDKAAIALKTTTILNEDLKFGATTDGSGIITITNNFHGVGATGQTGTSGFGVAYTPGTVDVSLSGKYFKIADADAAVAVWYDSTGLQSEPFHQAPRSIKVSIAAGDSATTVASKTATEISNDPSGAWTVGQTGAVITLTATAVGQRSQSAGTSGFTIVTGPTGAIDQPATIESTTGFNIFPLKNNTIEEIVATINTGSMVEAVVNCADPALKIDRGTREELGILNLGVGALAYGHDASGQTGSEYCDPYISLYDGASSVRTFLNSPYLSQPVPNFTLKTPLVLEGASSAYSMASAPNTTGETGEYFKLVPVTLQNVHHHLTHRALSQLPIVTEVDIAGAFKRLQIKSKQLGSAGAVEVVGGRANSAALEILEDAQTVADTGYSFLETKVVAAPFTLNVGDYVSVASTNPLPRQSVFDSNDTMAVDSQVSFADYIYKPHTTIVGQTGATGVTISSGSTGYALWAWQFTVGTDLTKVKDGDLMTVYGATGTWNAGNMSPSRGDGEEAVCGFYVHGVSAVNRTVWVVNPNGVGMTGAEPIGLGKTITFGPSPIKRWRLKHSTDTRYRIEKLGFNGLVRIRRISGTSPQFKYCGVGINDTLVIQGNTFDSRNTGKYTILGLTEDSLIIEGAEMVEQLDRLDRFNSANTGVAWTANSEYVVGIAGQFENLALGDWVRKATDDSELAAPVVGWVGGTGASTATGIELGSKYAGTSATDTGVASNNQSDINAGVLLLDADDLIIYKADSAQVGDSLFIDDTRIAGWFETENTGTFNISSFGVDSQYRPYLRVDSTTCVDQASCDVGASPQSTYVIEGADNATKMIKEVFNVSLDENDPTLRTVYLTPPHMGYKMTVASGCTLSSMGKLGFDSGVVTGVDGYQYYTGLLRKVQRIIDGYEPDSANYPGRRAIGGQIELLPPLIKRVTIGVDVTTSAGVNLSEITTDIASAIMTHINNLGVGQDVILSEIIVKIMGVRGVSAVTFITPSPSESSIPIDDVSKAFIEIQDITIT